MFKRSIWLFIVGFFCMVQVSRAQFDTQSPYSYYGIGTPVGSTLQNGFGMGSISQALRDSVYVNYLNPASYSSLDVTQLIFGFEGNFLTRTEGDASFNNNSIFINQFGLGIPIIHKHKFLNWGMYLGYSPYSNVGYKLADTADVMFPGDTVTTPVYHNYTGTGGLNRVTWGNGFQLGRNFSLGVNLHYLFGTSNRIRTLELPSSSGYMSSRVEEKTRVNNFSFDVGAQSYFNFRVKKYTTPKKLVIETKNEKGEVVSKRDSIIPDSLRKFDYKKRYRVVVGGTYNYGSTFTAGFEQLGIQYLSGGVGFGVDTFLLNPDGSGDITMPHGFGAGIALINPGIWMVSADFNYKLWSDFRYFDQPSLVYNNSLSLHLGAEYTPYFPFTDKYGGKRRFFKNIVYRIGARYNNRYYRPDSNPVDEFGFSFGLGLPFGFSPSYDEELRKQIIISYINLGIEGGFANSRGSSLVNESFVRFNISVTLRDKWFIKRRYN